MPIKTSMIVEDLVYALEDYKVYFNEKDTNFIMNILGKKLTARQEHAAEVIWDKRLKGREDYTKWDTDNRVVFDGKLYRELLQRLKALYIALDDDEQPFTDWERIFIEDVYTKYHPDNYTLKPPETFNPILSERQMEHVERIYEQVNK